MTVGIFVGTRPDIIKLSPIIQEMEAQDVSHVVVHSGQHFDRSMSESFFAELQVKHPDYFLEASQDNASSIQDLVSRSISFLSKVKLDCVLVLGDTNSAFAVALSSCLMGIPVAHVEAGCRSHDRSMPEEINRVLIADCATTNFAPTIVCQRNLAHEGVYGEILLTGHPIVDLINKVTPKLREDVGLVAKPRSFILLTLHRPENVDSLEKLKLILSSLSTLDRLIAFPVHPRTKKNIDILESNGEIPKNIRLLPPMGYFAMLNNIKSCLFVVTDSGGIQQEAFILNTPCLTIRRSFEWVETFEAGVNFLANPDRPGFREAILSMSLSCDYIRSRFANADKVFGDGRASERIVEDIANRYNRK